MQPSERQKRYQDRGLIDEADLAEAMSAGRRGDSISYESALRDVARLVRPHIRRKVGWALGGDLEDIVQETLLAVHIKNATWDEGRPILPWVFAIAGHKAIDAVRRHRREGRFVDGRLSIEELAEVIGTPAADRDLAGLDLDRYLSGLPSREQWVVRGLTMQGRSVREVAAALEMKEGAVRVALHRGLKRLARAARQEGS